MSHSKPADGRNAIVGPGATMGLISKLQRHMCLFRCFKICAIFERNTDFEDGQNPSHAIVIDALNLL